MPATTPSKRKGLPPALLIVVILLAVSVFINYVDRGNLSIAAPMLKDELGISASKLGILLSAFFWTYACLQPLAGWIADHWDVNWVLAAGFTLWSAATAATGLVHTFAMLMLLRLLVGVGESVAYPSYSRIMALHYDEDQRGFGNAIISSGLVLGPGFGMLFGGELMGRYGWRPFFFVLGLASLLWLIPWLRWMPRWTPVSRESAGAAVAPRLSEFLRMRSAWGTSLGLFCVNYLNYFLITWLPFYLVRERQFSMHRMAQTGGIGYLCAACSAIVTGWLSDRWIDSGATPTLVRKSIVGGGLALAGVFVGLAGIRGSVGALVAGLVFFGVLSSNMYSITQTLAGPHAAGRWTGLQNFVGNLAGFAAPAITGFVVDRTGHFLWAFAILAAIALLGGASFVFLVGPIEPVVWGKAGALEPLPLASDVGRI